jgi:ATP-dependent DNA helicase PIF1
MELSLEQEQALKAFNERKNIFLTGPGGSGKTALIKLMVQACKDNGRTVQVCALTGCAAVLLNCQAKTIHSWAGIGLANSPTDLLVKKVVSNKYKSKGWKKIDVLIVDEISMMSQKIFDALDAIGRKMRPYASQLPFGGIQLVFSGDFYQLPPVMRSEDTELDPTASAFCFESPLWPHTFHVMIELKKIFRQTDPVYMRILNQIRIGKLYKSGLDELTKHIGKPMPETFVPTILLPRRRDADMINMSELAKLSGEEKIYKLKNVREVQSIGSVPRIDSPPSYVSTPDDMEYNILTNSIMADKEIVLKKGAQVMCVANLDMESPEPIVNGSQGIIVDFVGQLPLVKFNNGAKRTVGFHTWKSEAKPEIGVQQIPLKYAWAITIHKAQGVSLDMAQIDAGSNIFECGQTYVALSRIKSLEGLYLTAFNPHKIKVNKKVQEFYAGLTKEEPPAYSP